MSGWSRHRAANRATSRPVGPHTPAWIAWDDDSHLYVDEIAGGDSRLLRLSLRGDRREAGASAGSTRTVFSFPGTVGDGRLEFSLSSTADRSLFVFRASTFDRPSEIYALRPRAPAGAARPPDALTQLTHFNQDVQPAWGQLRLSGLEERWISCAGLAACCPKITIPAKKISPISSWRSMAGRRRRWFRAGEGQSPQPRSVFRARLLCPPA